MNPLGLYQQALDVVSRAVLAGDFAGYLAMIDLPYLVQTNTANIVLTTPEDLRGTFDVLHQGLRKRGVTHYERVAREADYVGTNRIEGLHFTNMIANGERIAAPHGSQQSLVRRGAIWRFSEARYPFSDASWPWTDATVFGAIDSIPQAVGQR
jgi:hypothetical protein